MKKSRLTSFYSFTFSISGMATNRIWKTVEISKEVLLDKIKGYWPDKP